MERGTPCFVPKLGQWVHSKEAGATQAEEFKLPFPMYQFTRVRRSQGSKSQEDGIQKITAFKAAYTSAEG